MHENRDVWVIKHSSNHNKNENSIPRKNIVSVIGNRIYKIFRAFSSSSKLEKFKIEIIKYLQSFYCNGLALNHTIIGMIEGSKIKSSLDALLCLWQ